MPASISIFVKLNTAGGDTGPFNITDQSANLIASNVSKSALLLGVTYSVPISVSQVRIQSNNAICNNYIDLGGSGKIGVINNTSGLYHLHNVINVPGLTYSTDIGDISPGQYGTASYTSFTGSIGISITFTGPAGLLTLREGLSILETVSFSTSGSYNFATYSFSSYDLTIILEDDI